MTMTKSEYLEQLAELYRVANMSDIDNLNDIAPEIAAWIPRNACSEHCRAIETIVRGICENDEYQAWIDQI